mmetsp:Transcript_40548/g.114850  ORF Transcript_40548/g.114850 Transcript_40548/m.114850 type:complete len:361 (-) Transcript_40548:76-1158(-)
MTRSSWGAATLCRRRVRGILKASAMAASKSMNCQNLISGMPLDFTSLNIPSAARIEKLSNNGSWQCEQRLEKSARVILSTSKLKLAVAGTHLPCKQKELNTFSAAASSSTKCGIACLKSSMWSHESSGFTCSPFPPPANSVCTKCSWNRPHLCAMCTSSWASSCPSLCCVTASRNRRCAIRELSSSSTKLSFVRLGTMLPACALWYELLRCGALSASGALEYDQRLLGGGSLRWTDVKENPSRVGCCCCWRQRSLRIRSRELVSIIRLSAGGTESMRGVGIWLPSQTCFAAAGASDSEDDKPRVRAELSRRGSRSSREDRLRTLRDPAALTARDSSWMPVKEPESPGEEGWVRLSGILRG